MTQTIDPNLKLYDVTHRETGEKWCAISDNAEDACKQAGWLIGDCFVVEVKPQRKTRKGNHSALMVRIPCQVCPFQYAECKKPAEADCALIHEYPCLAEWLKRATEAHLCSFIGAEMEKKNHELRQKWLPFEEAISELSAKALKSPPNR